MNLFIVANTSLGIVSFITEHCKSVSLSRINNGNLGGYDKSQLVSTISFLIELVKNNSNNSNEFFE